jgi:hypothetical protein
MYVCPSHRNDKQNLELYLKKSCIEINIAVYFPDHHRTTNLKLKTRFINLAWHVEFEMIDGVGKNESLQGCDTVSLGQ